MADSPSQGACDYDFVLIGVGGIAAGIGTGAVALDSVPRYYNQLRQAMDTDIAALEQSITKLK